MRKYIHVYTQTRTQKHRNTAPPGSFNVLAPCDDSHTSVLQSYLQVYCDLGWGDRAAADLSLAVKAGTNEGLSFEAWICLMFRFHWVQDLV